MGKEYLDITAEDFALAKTDDEVFNKIYKANEKLVGYCLEKYSGIQVPQDELYNCLVDGLIKAINRYEPSKKVTFGNFAILCMMNMANMFLRKCRATKDVLWRANQCVSMDKEITNSNGSNNATIGDMLSDNSYEEHYEEEIKEKINANRLLSFLSERSALIFKMYFGGVNQAEVAKTMGCKQTTISSIVFANKLALKKLAQTALDVHSYVFKGIEYKDVAKLTDLSNVTEVEYYEAVYQYLYNNVDNIEEVIELGRKLKRVIPTLPENGKLNSDKFCEMI